MLSRENGQTEIWDMYLSEIFQIESPFVATSI